MSATEKITEAISNGIDHVSEIVKERLFSPMYFYFFIAWVIVNWQFSVTFFFSEESVILKDKGMLKSEYLLNLYQWNTWGDLYLNVSHLFIIPAISSFVIVWFLNKLSAIFYQKNEEHMMNKRIIQNDMLYREKVHYAKAQRKIRDEEADENEIKYDDNKEFNESYDDGKENVVVGEYDFLPSEVLYNTDYQAYKEELEKYKSEPEIRIEDVPF